MKKLLLIAAILAIGSTAFGFELDDGASFKDGVWVNNAGSDIAGFPTDITTDDEQVHREGAVNVFRDRGDGGDFDIANTTIMLTLIKPVKIESEMDYLYAEAFEGDNVQFGDIGFKVYGGAPVEVKFLFTGNLFDVGGWAKVKVLTDSEIAVKKLGKTITMTVPFDQTLDYDNEELEMDLYLETADDPAGVYMGVVTAMAEFQ